MITCVGSYGFWQNWRASYRWSIITFIFTSIFWLTWHFVDGSVPHSKLLGLSRWWDLLAFPLLIFSFRWFGYLWDELKFEDNFIESVSAIVLILSFFLCALLGVVGTVALGLPVALAAVILTIPIVILANVGLYLLFLMVAGIAILGVVFSGRSISVGEWLKGE